MLPKNKKKFLVSILFGFVVPLVLLGFLFLILAPPVLAQVGSSVNYGATFGLGTADLESTVIRIVQWALGFLGLVAVIIIMYGGFIWMTAAGNTEKVAKAKKIITRAVIGLIIVLLAWAIVTFVIKFIQKATNGSGSSCTIGAINGCYDCVDNGAGQGRWQFDATNGPSCTFGDHDTFHVKWVDPKDGEIDVPLCSMVQAVFNGKINAASVPGNAGLYVHACYNAGGAVPCQGNGGACTVSTECTSDKCDIGGTNTCVGDEVAGTWQVSSVPTVLEFLPTADYTATTTFRAELRAGITEDAATPRPFVPKTWWFTTGTTTLTDPPTVTTIYPADAATQVCLNTAIQSIFSSKMRLSSINTTTVKFRDETAAADANLASPFGYPNVKSYSTRPASPMNPGNRYSVTLSSGTPGGTCSNPLPVCNTKATCLAAPCNGTWTYNTDGIMDVCLNHLDGNYNTTQEGSPADNFMTINNRPSGGEVPPWDFTADTDTTNNKCIPEITSINPAFGKYDDGLPGVTITGSNFAAVGNIYFNNSVIDAGNCFDLLGNRFPDADCVTNWGGGSIDTRVPGGPINWGRKMIPSNGAKDGPVSIDIDPGVCVNGPMNGQACDLAKVPVCDVPGTCVTASNSKDFDVQSPQIYTASGLNSQAHGGLDQYVTLTKRSDVNAGFGAAIGLVVFRNLQTGAEVVAPFPPDPPCKSTWTDKYVVIKVPDLAAAPINATACNTSVIPWMSCPPASQVGIQLERADGKRSNIIQFVFTNEDAGPGLCEIQPQACGVVTNPRTLVGEKFGGAAGSVGFQLDPNPPVAAAITGWADQQVGIRVPNVKNAEGYEVSASNAIGTSNSLPFDVPCGGVPKVVENPSCSAICNGGAHNGEACVTDFDCGGAATPCTIQMASPHPYKDLQNVCLNAIFGARFTILMNTGTLNAFNLLLVKCNDGAACTNTTPAPGAITVFGGLPSRFTYAPLAALTPDTYYRFTIKKEVESDTGVRMDKDYVWLVKTKADATPCKIESVYVDPPYRVTSNPPPEDLGYVGYPFGPECQVLNPNDYFYNWSSSNPLVADFQFVFHHWQNVIQTKAKGQTYVRAETEGKEGKGKLVVDPDACAFDPTRCADPNHDGTDECPGSVCNITADRCMPVIADQDGDGFLFTPVSGPRGTTVSIEGCWFGKTQGTGTVKFGNDLGEFQCANPWSDHLIVTNVAPTTPFGINLIDVTTGAGFSTVTNSGQAGLPYTFNVNGLCMGICTAGAPNPGKPCVNAAECAPGICQQALPPGTGVPGLCPPLDPASGHEGTKVLLQGYNLFGGAAASNIVYYPNTLSDVGDTYLELLGRPGDTWTGTKIERSKVVNGAQTGGVNVQVDNCPSNSITFGIKCGSNGDCSTGCCKSKVCVDHDECINPVPGMRCELPANVLNNNTCNLGQTVKAGGDYRCIDTPGHLDPIPPPSAPYPPAGVDDCTVCCDANPPMSSASGLTCYPNKGNCTGAERGLYCGCVNNAECGAAVNGCGNDRDHCCWPRPQVDAFTPLPDGAASNLHCTNQVFYFHFNTSGLRMDKASMNLTTIRVYDQANRDIPGVIVPGDYSFRFLPKPALDPIMVDNIFIDVSDQVKNQYGVQAIDEPIHFWNLNNDATLCKIDHLDFTFTSNIPPPYRPPDNFRCATDNCQDDIDPAPGLAGNQHLVEAKAVDKTGTELVATYANWIEIGDTADSIALADNGGPDNDYYVQPNPNNGHAYVGVTATDTYGGTVKSGQARVNVFLCERPWPDPYPPINDEFPFIDSLTTVPPHPKPAGSIFGADFSTWYCRDPENLPTLKKTSDTVIKETNPLPNGANKKDELVKEYFFLRTDSTDGIGIRIMENESGLSPRQWYRGQFGAAAPEPQNTTVDGFPAVRAGRTVYVAAPKLDAATSKFVPYIYLISYNEGANDDTIAIYNKLLKNWEFAINLTAQEKEQLRRDTQRLADLNEIYEKLLAYKAKNGHFPNLAGGTFLQGLANSKWSSWQETLAAQLIPLASAPEHSPFVEAMRKLFGQNAQAAGSTSLPIDPINKFATSATLCLETGGYDAQTCYNESLKRFECPTDSHLYQYFSDANGDFPHLFANMEYAGAGSFSNYPGGNPCTDPLIPKFGTPNADCPCFNFDLNITGTAADHVGPVIAAVDALVVPPAPNAIGGTRNLDVTVTDIPSGVNRVEFFIDGVSKFTDSDAAGGWVWPFDAKKYTEGLHVLRVRAFDNVGNLTDQDYNLTIDNTLIPDSVPPFVTIIAPENGAEVSGTFQIAAQASDNRGLQTVTYQFDGTTISYNPGGTKTYQLNDGFDTTTLPNGSYDLTVDARDTSGNSAPTATIKVTVKNTDPQAPNVTFVAPNAGDILEKKVTIKINATDNNAVTKASFFVDGLYRADGLKGAGDEWTWDMDTTQYTEGDHNIVAFAYDAQDNHGSATVPIKVDNQGDTDPPIVTFQRPPTPDYGSLISGVMSISVEAVDNIAVDKVNFYQDYILRYTDTDGTDGWTWSIDTDKLTPGWHTFQVDALDTSSNRSTAIELRIQAQGSSGPSCGDHKISAFIGEECDFDVAGAPMLNGATCLNRGFDCGTLGCNAPGTANECKLDTSACVDAVCGAGGRQCNEQCDVGAPCAAASNTCQTTNCVSCMCQTTTQCGQPGCVPGSPDYCAVCNHCGNGAQDCDETGVDCGGAMCGACGCTPGQQRCAPDMKSTEICNAARVWVTEAQTLPPCAMANGAHWDGRCDIGNPCYNTTVSCGMTGGGVNAECLNLSLNSFQCIAACQVSWSAAYSSCCLVCTPGQRRCVFVGPTHTQICNAAGTAWVDEATTGPFQCGLRPQWRGNCDNVAYNQCFNATSCETLGNDAWCEGNNAMQCTPACQAQWNVGYSTCCAACNSSTCPNGCCKGPLPTDCVAYASQNITQCGTGGAFCNACSVNACQYNATCTNGVCGRSTRPDNYDCDGAAGPNICCAGSCGAPACGASNPCPGGGTCQNPDTCSAVCLNVCNATTCPAGCCKGPLATDCVPYASQTLLQCGVGGAACASCPPLNACQYNATCTNGICGSLTRADNYDCDGGGGSSICCAGTCGAPVCGLLKPCIGGQFCRNPDTCSAVCEGCNASNCPNGCCNAGSCLAYADQGPSLCGTNGNACAACAPGKVCTNGVCQDPPFTYRIENCYDNESASTSQFDPYIFRTNGLITSLLGSDLPYAQVFDNMPSADCETTYIYQLPATGELQYWIRRMSSTTASFRDNVAPPNHTVRIYNSAGALIRTFEHPWGCLANASYRSWFAFRLRTGGQPILHCGNVDEPPREGTITNIWPSSTSALPACIGYGLSSGKCCEFKGVAEPGAECLADYCLSSNLCPAPAASCKANPCTSSNDCCFDAPYCWGGAAGVYDCRINAAGIGEFCSDNYSCDSGRCAGGRCAATCIVNGTCEVALGENSSNCPGDCNSNACNTRCPIYMSTHTSVHGSCMTSSGCVTSAVECRKPDSPNAHTFCSNWPAGIDCCCYFDFGPAPNNKCTAP